MVGGLQGILDRRCLLHGIMLDMLLRGDSIYTVELRRPAALVAYVSFDIMFLAIHQNMGPA